MILVLEFIHFRELILAIDWVFAADITCYLSLRDKELNVAIATVIRT